MKSFEQLVKEAEKEIAQEERDTLTKLVHGTHLKKVRERLKNPFWRLYYAFKWRNSD